jgi:formylglycine-generating enzyme required for sulfatase activity
MLGKYAWLDANALDKSHPVGLKKPNDLGLSDMHGNSWEWCQSIHEVYRKRRDGKATDDPVDVRDITVINLNQNRVLGGGSFDTTALVLRSAQRGVSGPSNRISSYGFRLARTLKP